MIVTIETDKGTTIAYSLKKTDVYCYRAEYTVESESEGFAKQRHQIFFADPTLAAQLINFWRRFTPQYEYKMVFVD